MSATRTEISWSARPEITTSGYCAATRTSSRFVVAGRWALSARAGGRSFALGSTHRQILPAADRIVQGFRPQAFQTLQDVGGPAKHIASGNDTPHGAHSRTPFIERHIDRLRDKKVQEPRRRAHGTPPEPMPVEEIEQSLRAAPDG